MCWADYLGILWAFVVYFGIYALSFDKGAAVDLFASGEGVKLLLIVIAPVWIILRLLDAAAGGPARRKRRYR